MEGYLQRYARKERGISSVTHGFLGPFLFTDPMVTDVCDIPLGKEKGGSHERSEQKGY